MIDLVKAIFTRNRGGGPEDPSHGSSHDPRVAACALLLEMAAVDGEFDASERDRILAILKEQYGLSTETVSELVRSAEQEIQGSIDYWKFTRLINSNYSVKEKIGVIEMVWEIAFSDGRLDRHEDYLVHKLAELLNLSHDQLIHAKLRAGGKEG